MDAYWREESVGCFTFYPERHLTSYPFSPIIRYFKHFFYRSHASNVIPTLNMRKIIPLHNFKKAYSMFQKKGLGG